MSEPPRPRERVASGDPERRSRGREPLLVSGDPLAGTPRLASERPGLAWAGGGTAARSQ